MATHIQKISGGALPRNTALSSSMLPPCFRIEKRLQFLNQPQTLDKLHNLIKPSLKIIPFRPQFGKSHLSVNRLQFSVLGSKFVVLLRQLFFFGGKSLVLRFKSRDLRPQAAFLALGGNLLFSKVCDFIIVISCDRNLAAKDCLARFDIVYRSNLRDLFRTGFQ